MDGPTCWTYVEEGTGLWLDWTEPRTRALRRRHCVVGGLPVNFGRRRRRAVGPKKLAAARAVKFSNFAYLFQKLFRKELLLLRCACWTIIFVAVVWPQILNNNMKNIVKTGLPEHVLARKISQRPFLGFYPKSLHFISRKILMTFIAFYRPISKIRMTFFSRRDFFLTISAIRPIVL